MKTNNIKIAIALLIVTFSGCAKFTELEPKGANILQKVTDLDLLLNYEFYGQNGMPALLVGDYLDMPTNPIATIIANPVLSPTFYINLTCDESQLPLVEQKTQTSDLYTEYYGIIGKICNPVIMRADKAEGDQVLAKKIKAEAYVLRAFYHWNLVNLYAKAYDPVTAATDGGIPYSKETDLLSVPNPKYTVQEVYDFILDDLDKAISANALDAPTTNRMRVNSAFAYAVKAKVLLCMRDYEGAYTAATASLALENTVDDHNTMLLYETDKNTIYNADGSEKIDPITQSVVKTNGWSFSRPNAVGMLSREDLFWVTYSYLLFVGSSEDFNRDCDPGNILQHHANQTKRDSYSFIEGTRAFFDQDVYLNYGGLSTFDMYLVQAECKIRDNKVSEAMDIINMLRRHRIAVAGVYDATIATDPTTVDVIPAADYYAPLTAATQAAAINILRQVDREENWYNEKHFFNLKRWNTEEAWRTTITKTYHCSEEKVNEEGHTVYPITSTHTFTLRPDSKLWIWPFPQKSINMNPNISHNYN